MVALYNRPLEIRSYDTERYDFRAPICQALSDGLGIEVTDVKKLHTLLEQNLDLVSRETDQSTPFHTAYYENIGGTSFYETYFNFIRGVVQPLVGEAVYAQAVPNFRVQLPGNLAVGTYHRDRDFGHRNVINFWLPIMDAYGTNTVHLKRDNGEALPIPVQYGSYLRFDAENLLHGNELNTTPDTRASIDFRVIPQGQYEDIGAVAINTGTPLRLGDYYTKLD